MRLFRFSVVLCTLCAGFAGAQNAQEGIFVFGQGRVGVAPDMASIMLGVQQSATSPEEVMALVSRDVAAILEELERLGVAPKDRQTSGFFLQPIQSRRDLQVEGQGPKITGYTAGNTVSVQVRDLDRLEDVLAGVLEEGANTFNGLSFGVEASEKAQAQARAMAVQDAQGRAMQLADAAGVTLGPVLRIEESAQHAGPMMGRLAAESDMTSGSVATGEVEVLVQVSMVFSILPAQ